MKRRIISLLLAVVLLFALVGCSKPKEGEELYRLNMRQVKLADLGNMMPVILYAGDDQVCFWGTFGLIIANADDGSIYRGLDIEKLGYNYLTGELITKFFVSPGYDKIYFYNEGQDEENIDNYFCYYNVEEEKVRILPTGTAVEVREAEALFDVDEMAGGYPETGYYSNAVLLDDNRMVYLYAQDWYAKDLEIRIFDLTTEELTSLKLFG